MLSFSVSATTRAPRGTEQNGKDYYFLPKVEFEKRIANNEFAEFEEVYAGTYYGTLHNEIQRIWKEGRHVIFDVDVIGGLNLKKQFGDKAMAVFIQPPSVEVLRERLTNRGTDTSESVMKRLAKAERELSYASTFDKVILNDVLADTLTEAEKLVKEFIQ